MDSNTIIRKAGLVPVVVIEDADKAVPTAKALYAGGVRVMETTFNPSDPDTIEKTKKTIEILRNTADDLLVGAGTVIDEAYAVAAYEAGAKFILSPDTNPDIIRLTKKLGMLSIPGAYTPSEVMSAWRAGADMVKMFPITKDDIGYLINITRPLSHIPFLCTGGVNPDTIGSFFEAGASAVGTGISILKQELTAAHDYDAITALAKLHIERMNEARRK